MEDEFITEEEALAWVMQAYGMPAAAAKLALIDAWNAGVANRDNIINVTERDGEFVATFIPRQFSDMAGRDDVHDLRLDAAHLRWRIKQQLGEPPRLIATTKARSTRPDQATVNALVLSLAQSRSAPVKQGDAEVREECDRIGATKQQRLAALRELPDECRFGRGAPPKSPGLFPPRRRVI